MEPKQKDKAIDAVAEMIADMTTMERAENFPGIADDILSDMSTRELVDEYTKKWSSNDWTNLYNDIED